MTAGKRLGKFDWERKLLSDRTVIGNRLLVLLALGVFMDADGSSARPGVDRLAIDTGLGKATVKRHLAASVASGWLDKVRQGRRVGKGPGVNSEYAATEPLPGAH